MKRHPSLHPLSQHHHFALIQALEMRRAAEAPAEKRGAAVQRQAEKFLRFWHKTGHVHFREEEEVLLPAYARCIRLDQDAEVMRILADHAEIRAAVLNFEQCIGAKIPIEAEEIARIEKLLGEEQLNAMGHGLTRLHSKDDACEI
jgi:hypothetical protein